MSKVNLNLSQLFLLFQLFQLIQLFHSLRWNRRNRWNTLPAQPIPKNCYIPFTIPLFRLFLFLKIVKRNAVLGNCSLYFNSGDFRVYLVCLTEGCTFISYKVSVGSLLASDYLMTTILTFSSVSY